MPVSKEAYEEVRRIMINATSAGQAVIETLDNRGWLLTPEARRKVEIATLTDLWHRLDEQHPANIMAVFRGRNSGTPEDMYRALLDWLEAVIRDKEKGGEQ